jgi:hypothetical protein
MISKRPKRAARKQRLTELSARRARPQAQPFLLWDAKQSHLALRVRPSGSRTWVTIYSRHGRPRWLTLGDANAVGLADARTMAAEAMLAVAKGKDPAAEKKADRDVGTFADLHRRYLEGHAKKRNKSWRQGETLVSRYATPRWGRLQTSTITRADVKALMARIDAPVLANQVLAAVSAVFTWAVREDILLTNPCKLVARNPVRSRERVLADSEVPKFWAAFDDAGLIAGTALKVILLTGQRPGEVSHMRREHIRDGWWEMPGEPVPSRGWPGTKNAQAHRVRLSEPVQALIAAFAGEDWLRLHRRPGWRCHRLGRRHAHRLPQARRRARDPPRSATDVLYDGDQLGLRPRRPKPGHQPPRGRDRQRLRPTWLCRREQARHGSGRRQDHGASRGPRGRRQGHSFRALATHIRFERRKSRW